MDIASHALRNAVGKIGFVAAMQLIVLEVCSGLEFAIGVKILGRPLHAALHKLALAPQWPRLIVVAGGPVLYKALCLVDVAKGDLGHVAIAMVRQEDAHMVAIELPIFSDACPLGPPIFLHV